MRRSALHGLWESLRRKGYDPNAPHEEFRRLFEAYNAFARPDARRDFEKGSFAEFLRYMERNTPRKANLDEDCEEQQKLERRKQLSYQWRKRYVLLELRHLLALASLALVLGLGLGALFLGAGWLTNGLGELAGRSVASDPAAIPSLLEKAAVYAEANQATVVAAILSLFGVSRFLRDYLGDVQLWCTYEETNVNHRKRKEILRRGTDLLSHVLKDPDCERVVVVAHSLGTAVAVDSLMELGRYNRARNLAAPINGPLELEKFDTLVTIGCPTDKIHYFFESQAGSNHRYQRVVEEVRGDVGYAPFARNGKPFIHWINYWDQADIISGPIETASNPRWSALRVDNVQVSNYRFPDPEASHSGYFQHRRVIGDLFDIIFRGEHSFLPSRMKPRRTQDYEQLFLGPGRGSSLVPWIQAGALGLPWLILAGLLARHLPPQYGAVSSWLLAAGGILAGGLILGFVIGRLLGHREPVKPSGRR